MIEYPADFSESAKTAVQTARAKADLAYLDGLRQFDPLTRFVKRRGLIIQYIMDVVAEFGRQACELGRSNILRISGVPWSLDVITAETQSFLVQFALIAFKEKDDGVSHLPQKIDKATMEEFHLSSQWQDFQRTVVSVGEAKNKPMILSPAREVRPLMFLPEPTTGSQIRTLREECRMTLEDLAEAMDIEASTIHRHEIGKHNPRVGLVREYERIFSKSLERKIKLNRLPIKRL